MKISSDSSASAAAREQQIDRVQRQSFRTHEDLKKADRSHVREVAWAAKRQEEGKVGRHINERA